MSDEPEQVRMVAVRWKDAHADIDHRSWVHPSEIEDSGPYLVVSIGFLLPGIKEDHVSVAQSNDPEGNVDSILHIPSGMVVEVVTLESKQESATYDAQRPVDHPPLP